MSIPDHSTPEPSRADRSFLRRVHEIADFRSAHGRFPSSRADAVDERILGRWLSNVRTTHRGKTGKGPALNEHRVEVLNELLPAWSDVTPGNVADDDIFRQRIATVAGFAQEHGRLPLTTSDECDGLGTWLTRVKAASRGRGNMAWNAAREQLVREALPGWLDGPHQ